MINVVYTGKGKNNVLDRMAQALEGPGWEYTAKPTGTADLTYWICYIDYAEMFSDWRLTRTAAWFTHREPARTFKLFWWELGEQNVDIRVTVAHQYVAELEEYGYTGRVAHPPVDPQFVPQDRKANKRPRVGVAGFVHPGARKGEKLVASLAGSGLAKHADLVGAGQGWPVPTTLLDWAALPGWYNSLDVYLCPSLIEGVPMPPLEALSCGVPVVIPEGVGMLDDLPNAAGIYRYYPGDASSARVAVELALQSKHNRADLRALVAEYTAANWRAEHEEVFRGLVKPKPAPESDRHGMRGVIYVAYGAPARRCAEAAIASFKKHMTGVPVGLISTEPGCGEDVHIYCKDVDIGGRYAKTKIYELAPRDWQYILYLDVDTEVRGDISYLYNVLTDGWDMVICKNPAKYHIAYQMRRSDNADECAYTFDAIGTGELIQLNGGVFGFSRNARTSDFFGGWFEEWQKWGKRDQGALLRAMHRFPVKLWVLENYPWNTITRYDNREGILIAHHPMTARRWRGKVIERSDSQEAWQKVRQWEKEGGG